MPASSTLISADTSLKQELDLALEHLANPREYFTDDINHLAAWTHELAIAFVAYGDACPVGDDEDPGDLDCRLRHYEWAERAKHFLVLYRNVQVQIQTADLLVDDGVAEPEVTSALHERSLATLTAAREEWLADIAKISNRMLTDKDYERRQLAAYHAQRNPWPAYREQYLTIDAQATELAEEYGVLREQTIVFKKLREALREGLRAATDNLTTAVNQADQLLAYVLTEDSDASEQPGRVAVRLETVIADTALPPQMHDYTNVVTQEVKKLVGPTRVTVGTDHGMLQYKDVNFQRATDQWISAEVLPQFYEVWEVSEQVRGGLNVALNNVRNRALLAAQADAEGATPVEFDLDDLSQPLYNFLARAKEQRAQFDALAANVDGLVTADLRLSSVYRDAPGFLPLPLQTGINEFTRRQSRWLTPVKNWLGTTFAGLEQWRSDAVREDRMSTSEKVVRVIRQRRPAPGNEAYTNIVLTKGYIGESFLVGREAETEHVTRLIANWRDGFRGAVMLTGRRLSGKSLFGEMISNRLFPNNVFRLAPNTVLSVEGRRMTTTGKLSEALAFVQKHTLQSRPMIWIDDLELWWDKTTSLAENIRALANHIDNYSTRMFYLVSTTTANYNLFNRYRDLDLIFQATVNMDNFSLDNTQRAVRIRHGATHKLLVDESGEPIGELAFNRLVRRLHRATGGNIGATINQWAYLMEYCDEDRVTPSEEYRYRLPAFVTTDNGTLLTTLYRERRSNEYHLRRLYGPAFESRYRSVLQRLLRVGLLVRANDGTLRICESVVTDVATALENNGYLNSAD